MSTLVQFYHCLFELPFHNSHSVLQFLMQIGPTCTLHGKFCGLTIWPATMWGPAIVMVRVDRLSVCHARISPKLRKIDIWLLGNSNRKAGFPIQNLPSFLQDLRSEIRFRHFGCFRVGTSPIQTEMGPLAL